MEREQWAMDYISLEMDGGNLSVLPERMFAGPEMEHEREKSIY